MTQDARWNTGCEGVNNFIERELNTGELTEPRLSQFLKMLELSEKYKRKNQYV